MGRESKSGYLLIDKPSDVTSFGVVSAARRTIGIAKIGHTGTLDRFATGLLVMMVGKGTKLVPVITGLDKKYEALFEFGRETDTLDPTGKVTKTAPRPSIDEIRERLKTFIGDIDQVPPLFSAIHVDGKRAYERVRSGEIPTLKERKVSLYSASIMEWDGTSLRLSLHCSKGFYVRSLCRDLAKACGSCGHVKELRRTAVGSFLIEDAITLEDLEVQGGELLSLKKLFEVVPSLTLSYTTQEVLSALERGSLIRPESLSPEPEEGIPCGLLADGILVAVVVRKRGRINYIANKIDENF